MAAKGGDSSGTSKSSGVPSGHNPALDGHGGPRIVVNPSTFGNKKDALCVACNEAFRIVMEETGFEPVSEPTDAQREFFSDTAYADDELQLRRTIIARICTFDTSVKDPTDGQIQESVEFLHSVLEAGYPQNEWEQSLVQKLLDILSRVPTGRRGGTSRPEPGAGGRAAQGDMAGGVASNVEREEKDDRTAGGAVLEDPKYDAQGVSAGPQRDADVPPTVERRNEDNLRAGGAVLADPRHDAEGAEFDAERRRERQGA